MERAQGISQVPSHPTDNYCHDQKQTDKNVFYHLGAWAREKSNHCFRREDLFSYCFPVAYEQGSIYRQ
jgi:hypothetical protein